MMLWNISIGTSDPGALVLCMIDYSIDYFKSVDKSWAKEWWKVQVRSKNSIMKDDISHNRYFIKYRARGQYLEYWLNFAVYIFHFQENKFIDTQQRDCKVIPFSKLLSAGSGFGLKLKENRDTVFGSGSLSFRARIWIQIKRKTSESDF